MYRYFESKEGRAPRGRENQGLAGFAAMREAAEVGRDRPLAERSLTILGRAFLATLDAQADLLVLFASEHQLLADDARLVGFIDLAASGLGAELAARARGRRGRLDDLDGYLFARSFMGSLVSFRDPAHARWGWICVHPARAENYLAGLVDLLRARSGAMSTPLITGGTGAGGPQRTQETARPVKKANATVGYLRLELSRTLRDGRTCSLRPLRRSVSTCCSRPSSGGSSSGPKHDLRAAGGEGDHGGHGDLRGHVGGADGYRPAPGPGPWKGMV